MDIRAICACVPAVPIYLCVCVNLFANLGGLRL